MRSVLLLLAAVTAASAQPDRDLLTRFTAMGAGAAAQVNAGVLSFRYEIRPKQFAGAVMPAPPSVAEMRRIHLRIKSDHDTGIAVLLREKRPGGNYTAWFWAPANTWQECDLTPADFILSDGPQDPRDPDGKLDLDAVEGIGVFDLAQFFGALPENPDVPLTIDRPSGQHTFTLDDFQVVAGGPPSAAAARAGIIDAFDRGFLQWLTLGGMNLKLSLSGNPLGARAMEVTSNPPAGDVALVTRRLSNIDLSRATRLEFDVASQQEATIVVTLEQKDGKRFNLVIYPPGAKEVFHVSLRLQDFEGPGRVDAAQLKSLALADLTGHGNKMWIASVKAE